MPEPIRPHETHVYKTAGRTSIEVDIYLPVPVRQQSHPVLAFFHGGAWLGGNRGECCRPLFRHFLTKGFIIASFDYRLLPESEFVRDQLADVRDAGAWIHDKLPAILSQDSYAMSRDDVVVAGSSAGALLALLTPKVWPTPPTAILSIYGPTDMKSLPYLGKGLIADMEILPPSSHLLASLMETGCRPPNTPSFKSFEESMNDSRKKIGMYMFRTGGTARFLLRGLTRVDDGKGVRWEFPAETCEPSETDIEAISPLHLCRHVKYPPVCQVIGSEDSLFDLSHVVRLAEALNEQGIAHKEYVVDGADHAFDMMLSGDEEVFEKTFVPAVEWLGSLLSC